MIALLQAINKLPPTHEPYSTSTGSTPAFGAADVSLTTHVGSLLAAAYEHAVDLAAHTIQADRSAALLDLSHQISSYADEPSRLMAIVRARLPRLFDCERASLLLLREEPTGEDVLVTLAADDDEGEVLYPSTPRLDRPTPALTRTHIRTRT